MTRAEVALRWEATLKQLEARFIARIMEALRDQYAVFATALRHGGPEAAQQLIFSNYLDSKIGTIIQGLYVSVGSVMADQTKKAVDPKKSWSLKSATATYQSEINEYFRLHLLNRTTFRVSQTTRRRLLEILTQGRAQGKSVDQMVAEVNDLKEIANRAQLIVRTEVVRAANYGIYLGATKSDYEMQKTWLEVHDNRTRPSHRHATGVGGQTADLEARFSNGLLFPGDPDGTIEEVANCRCRIVVKAKRDAKGRPIRKGSAPAAPIYDRRSTGIQDALRKIEMLLTR